MVELYLQYIEKTRILALETISPKQDKMNFIYTSRFPVVRSIGRERKGKYGIIFKTL